MPRAECARCGEIFKADTVQGLSRLMDGHYVKTAKEIRLRNAAIRIEHQCTKYIYLDGDEGRTRSYGGNRWTESENGLYNGEEGSVPKELIKDAVSWD